MNSKERHNARYIRRKERRDKRKHELNTRYGNYDKDISVTELNNAFYKCRKNVKWKPSVQRYGFDLYKNSLKYHDALSKGDDIFKGFYEFEIYERGKKRKIRSVHISERCVEKSFATNSFIPILRNSLIYDTSASLKGRGTDFARKRVLKHLRSWYHFNGNNGYVIVGDFKSFFDSIDHDILINSIRPKFEDGRFIEFAKQRISHYGNIGLGLGGELNQIFAIYFLNSFDHYIKNTKHIKYYHRYNDDFYILCKTKKDAKELLHEIKVISSNLNIKLSEKKTYITKIKKGFSFLKKHYILTNSGKIITKHSRKNIKYERRKLRKFKKLLDNECMQFCAVYQQYASWRGCFKHTLSTSKKYSKKFKNEYKTMRKLDEMFNKTFAKYLTFK